MNDNRTVTVYFADEKIKAAYFKLEKEDPLLFKFLKQAVDNLKADPKCGIHIQKRLIPKVYIQKYGINNLWKYNLPSAWRLMYSLSGTEVEILTILLEWLPHDEYERRFKY